MTRDHLTLISSELDIAPRQVGAVAELLNDGATVPFISRYRKEATGSLDEVAITGIRDRLEQLEVLDKRREAIFKSLVERELLTPELKRDLENAAKKQTRAALRLAVTAVTQSISHQADLVTMDTDAFVAALPSALFCLCAVSPCSRASSRLARSR